MGKHNQKMIDIEYGKNMFVESNGITPWEKPMFLEQVFLLHILPILMRARETFKRISN